MPVAPRPKDEFSNRNQSKHNGNGRAELTIGPLWTSPLWPSYPAFDFSFSPSKSIFSERFLMWQLVTAIPQTPLHQLIAQLSFNCPLVLVSKQPTRRPSSFANIPLRDHPCKATSKLMACVTIKGYILEPFMLPKPLMKPR